MHSNAWPERALAFVASCSLEAGWITLIYLVVEGLSARSFVPLSIGAFGAAAAIGLAYSRWAWQSKAVRHASGLAGLVIGAAIVGWLVPLGRPVSEILSQPLAAVAAHPAGLLLGVAVWRGSAHAEPDDEERTADGALRLGLVGLVIAWVLLTATDLTDEPEMAGGAFVATVTLVTSALLAIGLARLASLRGVGASASGGRTWLSLLLGVVALMLVVAMPLALLLGVPVAAAVRGVLGPLGDVLIPAATFLLWPIALFADWLVSFIRSMHGSMPTLTTVTGGAQGGGGGATHPAPAGAEGLGIALLPIVVAVILAFLVLRRLLALPGLAAVDREFADVHESEPLAGALHFHRPRWLRLTRTQVPQNAAEAYLASVELLSSHEGSARLPSETPTEHARRVQHDPLCAPISRLAADYLLSEFGLRALSVAEHRRAVERWRLMRSSLHR
jgi:hypothetical protein